jgi:hypothetical protein
MKIQNVCVNHSENKKQRVIVIVTVFIRKWYPMTETPENDTFIKNLFYLYEYEENNHIPTSERMTWYWSDYDFPFPAHKVTFEMINNRVAELQNKEKNNEH